MYCTVISILVPNIFAKTNIIIYEQSKSDGTIWRKQRPNCSAIATGEELWFSNILFTYTKNMSLIEYISSMFKNIAWTSFSEIMSELASSGFLKFCQQYTTLQVNLM